MENLFKEWVEIYGFSKSMEYFADWIDQVQHINTYWDKIVDEIDRDDFWKSMLKSVNELNIHTEDFELEKAFVLAKTEWRIELMTRVANHIAVSNIEEAPIDQTIVKWEDDHMIISWN